MVFPVGYIELEPFQVDAAAKGQSCAMAASFLLTSGKNGHLVGSAKIISTANPDVAS